MPNAEEVRLKLKAMLNKDMSKVLFVEANSHFVDILLSFLTLPLGRIVKVLDKHYGDEAPTVGSITTLYHSLANLDSLHFWTEGAKLTLLNPRSSFEAEYKRLKLDISDSPPAEYFVCQKHRHLDLGRFQSVSVYYDHTKCLYINCKETEKELAEKGSEAADSDGGTFTKNTTTFIITDDLLISTAKTGLLQTMSTLGITDLDSAKLINISFGIIEIVNLLKASLISQTPLSDIILNGERKMNSTTEKSKLESSSHQVGKEEASNSKKMVLKVMVRKSTGEFLYAQAEEDFVELMFSFLVIPVGVQCFLAGNTSIKCIDNLYRSVAELIDEKYFKTSDTKSRLMKPNLPHGYISKNHVLPLSEECLPPCYTGFLSRFSSTKFPKGQGMYINGPITYHVFDDLTVMPFSIALVISSLSELNIPISDVKEMEVQIGLEEALCILKASLTSKTALTDGLLSHISTKQPKPELCGCATGACRGAQECVRVRASEAELECLRMIAHSLTKTLTSSRR